MNLSRMNRNECSKLQLKLPSNASARMTRPCLVRVLATSHFFTSTESKETREKMNVAHCLEDLPKLADSNTSLKDVQGQRRKQSRGRTTASRCFGQQKYASSSYHITTTWGKTTCNTSFPTHTHRFGDIFLPPTSSTPLCHQNMRPHWLTCHEFGSVLQCSPYMDGIVGGL